MNSPKFIQIGLGPIAEFAELIKDGWQGTLIDSDPLTFTKNYITLSERADLSPYFDNLQFLNVGVMAPDDLYKFTTYSFLRGHSIVEWSHTTATDCFDNQSVSFYSYCISLDTLLEKLDKPDIIAIDIEGAEFNLLRHYSFSHSIPCFQIEYHEYDHSIIRDLMLSHGYKVIQSWDTYTNLNEKFVLEGCEHNPAASIDIVGINYPLKERQAVEEKIKEHNPHQFPFLQKW